jgi:hypothetical protein
MLRRPCGTGVEVVRGELRIVTNQEGRGLAERRFGSKRALEWLDAKLETMIVSDARVGFPDAGTSTDTSREGPPELEADVRAALLATYAGQFGSYTTMLWQVPALSLTAQAFLFTIALAKDVSPGARIVTGLLSVVTTAMSIYLMVSHRIHAERQGRVAEDLAKQLGAVRGLDKHHRGAAGVWVGVNRGSFALWILGLGLFGMVGFGAAVLGLWEL